MSFRFYPTLESKKGLLKKINIVSTDEFRFFRCNEYGIKELSISSGRIKDTLWDPVRDSLRVCRDFKINDPYYLYGKEGIACADAELGVCISWVNPETSMAGCILPQEGTEKYGENGWSVFFDHTFTPGETKGHLELKLILYLKKAAEVISEGEEILNNMAGVVLGELEMYRLEISDETMPFPFVVVNEESDVLWWVDFYSWDDPAEDAMFGPSSFIVNVNSRCKGCPKVTGKGIQNLEMMYEITASVYALLFKKLDLQQFRDMRLKKGKPGTISAELSRLYEQCKDKFDYQDEYETIHKSMQAVIKQAASNVSDIMEVSNE